MIKKQLTVAWVILTLSLAPNFSFTETELSHSANYWHELGIKYGEERGGWREDIY